MPRNSTQALLSFQVAWGELIHICFLQDVISCCLFPHHSQVKPGTPREMEARFVPLAIQAMVRLEEAKYDLPCQVSPWVPGQVCRGSSLGLCCPASFGMVHPCRPWTLAPERPCNFSCKVSSGRILPAATSVSYWMSVQRGGAGGPRSPRSGATSWWWMGPTKEFKSPPPTHMCQNRPTFCLSTHGQTPSFRRLCGQTLHPGGRCTKAG